MTPRLFLPFDEVSGGRINSNIAADFLELSAFSSVDCIATTSELANEVSIGAEEAWAGPNDDSTNGEQVDVGSLDNDLNNGEEELVSCAVNEVVARRQVLGCTYPFWLDETGDVLTYDSDPRSLGHAAYVLCLLLSNLRGSSAVLAGTMLHPNNDEERLLRNYFQYFATAALAAEIRGTAWSFGSPRRDGSGFIEKLKEIWGCLNDGKVDRQIGATAHAKDDGIDVFAARPHSDQLPGFLLATAQVTTGQDMRQKALTDRHLSAFKGRWFVTRPVTDFITYMIVPFAIASERFIDDVREVGNILHRLRVPLRVAEAGRLVRAGVKIEEFDQLAVAAEWLESYRHRVAN